MLRDMLGKFVIAYIDDIVIYFPSLNIHVTHIRQALPCLLENQLYGEKGEKCEFDLSELFFLRYIINQEGVLMDEVMAAAVIEWPTLKTVKDL